MARGTRAPRGRSTVPAPPRTWPSHRAPPPVGTAPAQDYPEHRLQFFSLLRAITNHCSATLFAMSPVRARRARAAPSAEGCQPAAPVCALWLARGLPLARVPPACQLPPRADEAARPLEPAPLTALRALAAPAPSACHAAGAAQAGDRLDRVGLPPHGAQHRGHGCGARRGWAGLAGDVRAQGVQDR